MARFEKEPGNRVSLRSMKITEIKVEIQKFAFSFSRMQEKQNASNYLQGFRRTVATVTMVGLCLFHNLVGCVSAWSWGSITQQTSRYILQACNAILDIYALKRAIMVNGTWIAVR